MKVEDDENWLCPPFDRGFAVGDFVLYLEWMRDDGARNVADDPGFNVPLGRDGQA